MEVTMADKRVGLVDKRRKIIEDLVWKTAVGAVTRDMSAYEFYGKLGQEKAEKALTDLDACELTVEELAELINREFLPEEGKKWEWAKKLAGEIVEARERKRHGG